VHSTGVPSVAANPRRLLAGFTQAGCSPAMQATGLLSQMNHQLQKLRDKNQKAAEEALWIRVQLAAAADQLQATAAAAPPVRPALPAPQTAAAPRVPSPADDSSALAGSSGAAAGLDVACQFRMAEGMLDAAANLSSSARHTSALPPTQAEARAAAAAAETGSAIAVNAVAAAKYGMGPLGSDPVPAEPGTPPKTGSSFEHQAAGAQSDATPGGSAHATSPHPPAEERQQQQEEEGLGMPCGAPAAQKGAPPAADPDASLALRPAGGGSDPGGLPDYEAGVRVVPKAEALMSPLIQREVVQNGFGLPGSPPVLLPKQVRFDAWLQRCMLWARLALGEGRGGSCKLVRGAVAARGRALLLTPLFRCCTPADSICIQNSPPSSAGVPHRLGHGGRVLCLPRCARPLGQGAPLF
jgi:hypothetical protein